MKLRRASRYVSSLKKFLSKNLVSKKEIVSIYDAFRNNNYKHLIHPLKQKYQGLHAVHVNHRGIRIIALIKIEKDTVIFLNIKTHDEAYKNSYTY